MFDKYTGGSKSLKRSVVEGCFGSILLTAGASFIIPFALYLGANSIEIGFLNAFPILLGAWLQLLSIKLLERYRSRKRLVVVFVALQALSWAPIALLPFIPITNKIFWLFVFYTAGVVFGGAPGPIWQSWMKSLIPSKILGTYFGFRTAVVGAFSFIVLLFFGWLLGFFESAPLIAFAFIFGASVLGRLLSSLTFTKISEAKDGNSACIECTEINGSKVCRVCYAPDGFEKNEKISFLRFLHNLKTTNFGYFVLFGSLMTFAISLVGPFFSMYLINDLKIDYFSYTLIVASTTLSSLISMPYWGRLMDRHGTRKILKATSLLAAFYPIALIFSRNVPALIVAEFFNGVIFSGFTLALANFIYDSSKQSKIIKFASYQAVLFGTATFFGVMLGSYLMDLNLSFGILSNSFYVICASAVVIRLVVYKALIGKVREVKPVEYIPSKKLVFAALTLRPVREDTLGYLTPFIQTGIRDIEYDLEKVEDIGRKELRKAEEVSIKELKKAEDVSLKEFRAVEDLGRREFRTLKNDGKGVINAMEGGSKKKKNILSIKKASKKLK